MYKKVVVSKGHGRILSLELLYLWIQKGITTSFNTLLSLRTIIYIYTSIYELAYKQVQLQIWRTWWYCIIQMINAARFHTIAFLCKCPNPQKDNVVRILRYTKSLFCSSALFFLLRFATPRGYAKDIRVLSSAFQSNKQS